MNCFTHDRSWHRATMMGLIAIAAGLLAPTLTHADDAEYVSDLTTGGFIQPMQLSSPYAYVPVGSRFGLLNSPDAESEVCLALLSVAVSQDSTITTVVFLNGDASVGQCTAAGYQRN